MPYTSYSSSDGEDDFEDANEEFFNAQANSPSSRQHIVGDMDEEDDDPVLSVKSDHTQSEKKGGTLPINRDGSLDYDGELLLFNSSSSLLQILKFILCISGLTP